MTGLSIDAGRLYGSLAELARIGDPWVGAWRASASLAPNGYHRIHDDIPADSACCV